MMRSKYFWTIILLSITLVGLLLIPEIIFSYKTSQRSYENMIHLKNSSLSGKVVSIQCKDDLFCLITIESQIGYTSLGYFKFNYINNSIVGDSIYKEKFENYIRSTKDSRIVAAWELKP